jgi:nitroreductase
MLLIVRAGEAKVEFKRVLGRRRSIRYFQPWRPVEREKVQKILEAARIASCAVNASYLRGVVVNRDDIPSATLDRLKTPPAATNYDLAPTFIFFFGDTTTVTEKRGATLRQLVDVGALNPSHGWSHKFVDELIFPQILEPMTKTPERLIRAVSIDCGVAICQALLTAFDEELGACLSSFNGDVVKEALDIPDHWMPMYALLLGYPAESWQAGGQRPRPPLEELFFEGTAGTPFRRDQAVVTELEQAEMLTAPAPLPWRKAEVRALARMLGLPE